MELKMAPYTVPKALSFNFDELRTELIERAEVYETIVYTDDQVKAAKEDRAKLNRLKKALNDERIRLEREYMEPFAAFKAQINEIIGIIDRPVAVIDRQVKAFEEQRREEKRRQIEACWQEVLQADGVPAAVCFSHVWDEKWLNASVPMTTIKKAMVEKLERIAEDLAVIRDLPAYAFEAKECYLDTLDLARAISEAHRLQETELRKKAWEEERKAKAEQAQHTAEQAATIQDSRNVEPSPAAELPTEPKREWIAFQALLSPDEAHALGQYMKNNGIKYKAV